jgi:hypothetical protein
MAIPDLTKPQAQHRSLMTLATQAMEAFGISGQGKGCTGRLPRQASMEKDSPLWPSHYMEKLLSRAKPRTTRHASQKERSQHAADQFQQRSTEMWRTSNSLYAPGRARRRSARRQRYHYSTRRSQRRQSRPTGRRYKPATGRWSTTEHH